jgi:RHS repeat-associated protein
VAELNASGQLTAVFVYGSRRNTPDLVIKIDPNTGIKTTYRLFSDQIGSPRLAVNVDNPNDVPYRVDYSAFGKPTWTAAVTEALDWIPFGFAGGIYDKNTGLLRFGARDYDPIVGRWVSKDPSRFGGGINLYVYSWNDPVNFRDPTGRQPTGAGGASGTGDGGSEGTGGVPWTPETPWPLDDRDWCGSAGSGWVPESDPLGGSNYQPACKTHDECYAECGSDKFDCDWNLGQDMQKQCIEQGDPCNVAGLTYSAAVYSFGDSAYDNAQADCVCESP